MRRILCLCTVLLTVVLAPPAFSQTQNDGWRAVRDLPVGKTIDVYTGKKHQRCKLLSADDQQISCQHGKNGSYALARSEITRVRLPYTGIFTVGGLVVGTGVGLGIGYAVGQPHSNEFFGGITVAVDAAAGAVIGAVAGTASGFIVDKARQKTLYLAP